MRDPTRGGVATVLNELAVKAGIGIEIEETALPVRDSVKAMCEILGFDPLHVANEGKVIIVASERSANDILKTLKGNELGKDCAIIGRVVKDHRGRVVLKNADRRQTIYRFIVGRPVAKNLLNHLPCMNYHLQLK